MAKVIIYSTPTCPWCQRAKEFLKENNVPFESKDVSSDHEALHEMMDKSGQNGVPVLDVGGRIIVGFDETGIRKALGKG